MADAGHIETELILRETEADVQRVYRRAVEEAQKKLEDYLRRYQIKDNIKRQQLDRGEITAQEYTDWRRGQIMISKRWEELRDTLAQDLHNSNAIARSIVRGHMPEVYAVNHNYATFQIERGSMLDTSYTLYDRQTVERIIRDQPELLPPPGKDLQKRIAANKDIAWQRGQIQSVALQSILQGESIPKMARRIAREVGEKNNRATVRYARTAVTGAQNAGRVDAYRRAENMGIELEQEWLATLDGRTRHSHRQMDGQHVKVGEKFSNGCRFPGDPSGPGWEIWNCRCTLVPRVKGVDQSDAPRNSKLGSMTYDEWKHEHTTASREFIGLRSVLGDGFVDGMETMLNFTEHTEVRDLFYKYQDKLKVTDSHNTGGAYYSPVDGGVHINSESIGQGGGMHAPYQAAYHEFAHNIDHAVGGGEWCSVEYMDGLLDTTITDDWSRFVSGFVDYDSISTLYDLEESSYGMRILLRSMDGGSKDTPYYEATKMLRSGDAEPFDIYTMFRSSIDEYVLEHERTYFEELAINSIKKQNLPDIARGNISDIIESCCPWTSYPLGYGHGASYWRDCDDNRPIEFFAEVCDSMVSNPESYSQMETLFPNAVKVVKNLIGEMLI